MNQCDMAPFPMPTGEVCASFFNLDLPMGTGVTRQHNSNRVIARNRQLFSWLTKEIMV